MTDEFYLIRHAMPDWERKDIPYHLPPGPPLTIHGEAEARALGYFLRDRGLSQLFYSPLERCRRTAEIAGGLAGLECQVIDWLIEWQPYETLEEVGQRMGKALRQAQTSAGDGTAVGLVTHGGPVAALLRQLGMSETALDAVRKYDHRNPLPTAGAWRVCRPSPQAAWQFELVFVPEVVGS